MRNIIKKVSKNGIPKKGAALIIALLVITVVSGITFYTSRLTIREIIVMSRLENSINAYYAAEAGIEQGLLMFKYNHDVESSRNASENDVTPIKITMDNDRSYELKIWHKKNASEPETGILKKDEATEYNIENMNNLSLKCTSGCDVAGKDIYTNSLEFWTIDNNNSVSQKDLISQSHFGINQSVTISTNNVNTLRLRSWGNDKGYILTAPNQKIDSRYTTIESIGTFGDTKRKIRVQLDRNSGRIISIFDFVLFGGNEIKIEP